MALQYAKPGSSVNSSTGHGRLRVKREPLYQLPYWHLRRRNEMSSFSSYLTCLGLRTGCGLIPEVTRRGTRGIPPRDCLCLFQGTSLQIASIILQLLRGCLTVTTTRLRQAMHTKASELCLALREIRERASRHSGSTNGFAHFMALVDRTSHHSSTDLVLVQR